MRATNAQNVLMNTPRSEMDTILRSLHDNIYAKLAVRNIVKYTSYTLFYFADGSSIIKQGGEYREYK